MVPHTAELIQAYFKDSVPDELPDGEHLLELIERLQNSRIRFCICDPNDDRIYHVSLFASKAAAAHECADHMHIAPVVLPN